MTRARLSALSLLAVAASGALVGCEVAFDPIEDSTRYFTMSGYLDTQADTQWVQVELVDTAVTPSAALLDVQVVLAGPRGEVPFTQKVLRSPQGVSHLFWAATDVDTEQSYAVVARRPDGATTTARVRTPAPDPPPVLLDGAIQCPTRLTLTSTQPIGDAFVTYQITGPFPRRVRLSRRDNVVRVDGAWVFRSYFATDVLEGGLDQGPGDSFSSEIALAVVTDDWPEETDLETALTPTDSPLVENGFGFVGGATVWRREFQPAIPVGFGAVPCYEPGTAPR